MFTALLISVTSWYRQVSRGPEKGHDLLLSGQDTASGALSSVLLPQHHLDSRVFPDRAEEAPNSVCHGRSLGLLVTYPLRLLVMRGAG